MSRALIVTAVLVGTGAALSMQPQHLEAQATPPPLRLQNTTTLASEAAQYWTPERLASAQPKRLQVNYAAETFVDSQSTAKPQSSAGRAPEAGVAQTPHKLYD